MVTTVAPVHIALMGIERLVPGMDDLGLMLSLLPRSATGQKLSVYTSLLNKPRRPGDPDGPQERHLILVDNGRRSVLGSDLQEILYCIRCGACLNACPVFREIGGHAYASQAGKSSPYPGPMGSVVSPALFGSLEYGHLARASSLCGACREACPVDIDLPKLLLRVRAGIRADPQQPRGKPNAPWALAIGIKLFSLAGSASWRFTLAQQLAAWFGKFVSLFSKGDDWMHMPKITGWGSSKDFPRPAAKTFRSTFLLHKPAIAQAQLQPIAAKIQPAISTRPGYDARSPGLAGKAAFTRELTALGGHVSTCRPDGVGARILQLLNQHGTNQLLVWDADWLPPGLARQLVEAGIQLIHPTADTIQESSRVRAGLTGALAGIANTGSLVLVGSPGKPLTASLLPEMHITILEEEDIVEDLGQVLKREEVSRASAAVVITGPSRTADIEMALTIGVHGPGELQVLLVEK
jgi:L-lactate dehydrogenase complex protein LldF